MLRATAIGFETFSKAVSLTAAEPSVDMDDVYIPKKTTTLEGVVIVASAPAVSQRAILHSLALPSIRLTPMQPPRT
ncbi:hypothetical protein LWM68_12285 [Niabella sp. W65]|nr:hypothetical protein [Niabella sp. W65]MCH7363452.1 hypothetical protein [Niabella sp. W65]ULT39376.1 hypothetical protein KRR40_31080 [Niabella sp. I65]